MTRHRFPAGVCVPVRCGYVVLEEDFLGARAVIRDTCEPGRPSITNDVENLVPHLLRERVISPGGVLLYYDSDGRRDEIVFNADGFVRFAPLPCSGNPGIGMRGVCRCFEVFHEMPDGRIRCSGCGSAPAVRP